MSRHKYRIKRGAGRTTRVFIRAEWHLSSVDHVQNAGGVGKGH